MEKTSKSKNAAIIIIGNEILSGRTQDVNLVCISNWLNKLGVTVNEVRVIPDIEDKIIKSIRDLKENFDYIFTTGGIGPTHDDITSESVSKALNLKYEFNKEAFELLEKHYGTKEFNQARQKMAKMPENSSLIKNPSSGAPGFYVENVFCLPGVPIILKAMLGELSNKITGGKPVLSKVINLKTLESKIAVQLEKIQENHQEVEIGSYPYFKSGKLGVSIVMRSKEELLIDKCKKDILILAEGEKIELVNFD